MLCVNLSARSTYLEFLIMPVVESMYSTGTKDNDIAQYIKATCAHTIYLALQLLIQEMDLT